MEQVKISRRDFLQTAAAVSAAAVVSGEAFKVFSKPEPAAVKKSIYVCAICGHVEFGSAPEFCPVCHAPRDKFEQNDTLFSDAEAKAPELAVSHAPVLTVKKKSSLVSEMPCMEVTFRIGKKLHPMEEAHHIKFIDCYVDDKYVCRTLLTLGNYAAGTFQVKPSGGKVRIVHVCNLHGHWQAEKEAV
jgi:desulfoferrodoxin-like iron-binding protein